MKTASMDTPTSRAQFERKMSILLETVKGGRLKIASHINVDGLLRVRYLPNGRTDLLSIDEQARLMANMMGQFLQATDGDRST